MRLPIELIAAVMVVAFLQRDTSFGAGSPASLADCLIALGGLAVYLGSVWGLAGLGWLAVRRELVRRPERRAEIWLLHGRLLAAEHVYAVAAFAVFLACTRWAALVANPGGLNAGATLVGDDILQILPFLLASAALWVANYPASRELGPADWSLGEYLRQQARFTSMILAPWLLMAGAQDSVPYWPAPAREYLAAHKEVGGALTALAFAAMLAVFPAYLVHLWPAARLPDGPLRDRLEALLRRAGVRCRELVVWRTGRGRVPNAAVMGVIGRFRYVAFTDALLGDMSAEEVEAVLAHEVGHARHGHILFYVLFMLAFLPLAVVVLGLAEWLLPHGPGLGPPEAAVGALLLAALAALYWRYAFGFLSRRFEREADVAACELVGTPLPLMTALEKLAAASGVGRRSPSWRHHSVAERVDFAARYGFDREALLSYHRRLRAAKAALALAALFLIGGFLYLGRNATVPGEEPSAGEAKPAAKRR